MAKIVTRDPNAKTHRCQYKRFQNAGSLCPCACPLRPSCPSLCFPSLQSCAPQPLTSISPGYASATASPSKPAPIFRRSTLNLSVSL